MSEHEDEKILKAIQELAEKVDSSNEAIKALADHMDEENAKTRSELRSEIGAVRADVQGGTAAVKKELSDFRFSTDEGFNSVEHMIREEDKKIDRLTEKLLLKKVITEKDSVEILGLGAFPLEKPISS